MALPVPLPKIVVSQELCDLLHGIWHDRLQEHAIIVSYLAARFYGVVRMPTRPDRAVDGKGQGFHAAAKRLDRYTDAELASLVGELQVVTTQTQAILGAAYPGGTVTLQRAIAPIHDVGGGNVAANRACDSVEDFAMLAVAIKKAGLPDIQLDVDIVSGWSTSALNRYGTVKLRRVWPIADVMLVSDLIVGPAGRRPMEDNEWLCVNRDPRGLMTIAAADFDVEDLPQRYLDELAKRGPQAAEQLRLAVKNLPLGRHLAMRPIPRIFGNVPEMPPASRFNRLCRWLRGPSKIR